MRSMRLITPIWALATVLTVFLGLTGPTSAWSGADALSREIHLINDPDWGEAEVILRFPMALVGGGVVSTGFLVTDTREGKPFTHIDQAAYEDDYSGFVAFLLRDYRFTVNGQEVTPELGTLSLVVTRGAVGLYPGLTPSLQLLNICTAFPGRENIHDLEVVFQLYLSGTSAADVIGIEVVGGPEGRPVETTVTDHRSGQPVVEHHAGTHRRRFSLSVSP